MADAPAVLEAPPAPELARAPARRIPRVLTVAAAAVAAAATLPAVYLVVRASEHGITGIARTMAEAETARLLVRTIGLCAAVTATAVVIATPLAWLTVRTDVPLRRFWVVASALPLTIPSFVGGYAFVAALGPRGIVQGWLEPLGVDQLPTIYGFTGAWLVLSLFTYPLVLLPVRAAWRGLDPSLDEAARSLGRSRRETFTRITLPHLRPSIVAGALLVALYTLSDFGAVSLLRFDSFTRAIFIAYRSSFDRSAAATLGLVLVALMGVVLVVEAHYRGRAVHHATHRGTVRTPPTYLLGLWRWPAAVACALLVCVALVVPLGVVAYWLWRGVASGVPARFALEAATNSLRASSIGAAAAVVCAWPVAMLGARHGGRASTVIDRISFTGYALPGIVVALALVFFGARYVPAIYQTMALLVFVYVVHFLPQATGSLRSSIAQIHPGLEEAARSLGASPAEVFRRITLPLVRPGVLTAFALVFLTVMKELPATLLLAPTGFRTLATEVWDAAAAASFARAAPSALGLVLLSSVPLAVLVLRERTR